MRLHSTLPLFFLTLTMYSCLGPSPGTQSFVKQAYGNGVVDGFWLYVPEHYDESKSYSLILFLTGGRTATSSNHYDAKDHGPVKFINNQSMPDELRPYMEDSFLIINPHMKVGSMENRQWYQHSKELIYSLHKVHKQFPVDWSRVYITGLSRGGHGAWGVAKDYPDYFAAIAPLAGRLSCNNSCDDIERIPKWLFHGDQDDLVEIDHSIEVIGQMESHGINFHHYDHLDLNKDELDYPYLFTQFEGRGHDIWDDVYSEPNFYRWLLQNRK